METIREISERLHQDPEYGPALTRFRTALADNVTLKADKDKTAKVYPSFKHVLRDLEEAGITIGYHHLQNGHMEHKVPQLAPAFLHSVAAHIEKKAKEHSASRIETLNISVSFDAAHQGDVTREELEDAARTAIEERLASSKPQQQAQSQAQSPIPIKP